MATTQDSLSATLEAIIKLYKVSRSTNPVLCPQCSKLKTIFVFLKTGGAACINCVASAIAPQGGK